MLSKKSLLIYDIKHILVFSCVLFLLFGAMVLGVSAASISERIGTIRKDLWNEGGVSTASADDILSANALAKYIESGVFGDDCKSNIKNIAEATWSGPTILQEIKDQCPKAGTFYDNASTYSSIVSARMIAHDRTGSRLDAAMERFSGLAQTVFSILIGFGFLTSILVFTILFLRLAWLPTHQIQRRSFFEDVLTAGVGTMLLGNIWIVISLFQSSFNRFWQTFAVYSKDWRTVANMVLVEYKSFIVGISGIATLVVLAMFVVNFALLALDGSNIQKRGDRISAITQCGIASVGLGAVTLIVGFFWSALSV